MRLDQWLWAVRLYKTRPLAVQAIKGGHVKINGDTTKPAHEAKVGEVIAARTGSITRTYRVLDAPKSRLSAKLVPLYAEDLTPPEELERQRLLNAMPGHLQPHRPRGAGRPTKKERRVLDQFSEEEET